MSNRIVGIVLVVLGASLSTWAADPPLENKLVVLTRPGVELQLNAGETILPRTAGFAQDITFRVLKEVGNRLQVESRRQRGWIGKADAVPFDKAVVHFTEQLA